MMYRTHLAVALFVALIFLPSITEKIVFLPIVLISTFIPDLDSPFSHFGKYKASKTIQIFTKHRGFLHSFTIGIIISVFLAFFFPILALPFFLGYSTHIILDSFTPEGTQPFWPSKKQISWKIKTSSFTEATLFFSFAFVDIILILLMVNSMF